MEKDTICAISTPLGVGGISIIRMSGEGSLKIAYNVFKNNSKNVFEFEPRKLYLGKLTTKKFVEQCLMVYFKAPYSYTGEDMVEFQCHGGLKLAYGVLEELIDQGARLADSGEFTKLAFLNGKLSLDEAEGVIDVINSESESEIRAGYDLMQGKLKQNIEKVQNILTDCLAKLEVAMDYPEEDLEEETKQDVSTELINVKQLLINLYNTSSTGIKIKNGTKLVILGKTNVGKSSLMNALLNYDRAIVTNIQGTTRDTLEETFEYKGIKFNLVDTAGIRKSNDIVENIGIEKSKKSINVADLVLFVVDASKELSKEDYSIVELLKNNENVLLVVNKSDLGNKINLGDLGFDNYIAISAKEGKNIIELKEKIYNTIFNDNILQSSVVLTNMRHIQIIKESIELVDKALNAVNSGLNLDLSSVDIKNIWLKLGEITGETNVEEIINTIFSKFCVGK